MILFSIIFRDDNSFMGELRKPYEMKLEPECELENESMGGDELILCERCRYFLATDKESKL